MAGYVLNMKFSSPLKLRSGIDKVILDVEQVQLPVLEFIEMEQHTKVILFAHIDFKDLSKNDRIKCCY